MFAFGFASSNAVCAAGNTNEGISLVELPANDGGNSITCLEEKTVMEQPASDNTLPVRSAEKTGTECTTADAGRPSKSSHLINHPAKIVGKNRKEQVKQSRGTGPVAGCFVVSIAASSVGAVNSGLMNTIGKTPKQKPDDPKEEDNLKDQEIQKLKEELEQLRKKKEELEKQNENPTGKKSDFMVSTIVFASVISIVILTGIIIWLSRKLKAEKLAADYLWEQATGFCSLEQSKEADIKQLKDALSLSFKEYGKLQKDLALKTEELIETNNQYAGYASLLKEKEILKNQVKAQEVFITNNLNPEIKELEAERTKLKNSLTTKEKEITQLKEELSSTNINELKEELQKRISEVDELNSTIKQLNEKLTKAQLDKKVCVNAYKEKNEINKKYEEKFGAVKDVTPDKVSGCIKESEDLKRRLFNVYLEYKKVRAALKQLKTFVDDVAAKEKRHLSILHKGKFDIEGAGIQLSKDFKKLSNRQQLLSALQSNVEKAMENSEDELSNIANKFSEEEKENLNAQEGSNYGFLYRIQYNSS